MSSRAHPKLGSQIGRFRLIRMLGEGGFAAVYLAEDPALGRKVALKLLHSRLTGDDEIIRRFKAEARLAAGLKHPNIVTVHDVGVTNDDQPYLVMELLTGVTLSEALATAGPFPHDFASLVVTQLASALDYIHGRGLVHRDVKPSNVMIGDEAHVTLMDFGISKRLSGEGAMTLPGEFVGTLNYMAQEQIKGEKETPATDVYALGLVTYEMLVGRPVFSGGAATILHDQLYVIPPGIRTVDAALPASIEDAISEALAKSPSNRPQSASSFSRAFALGASAPTVAKADRQPRTRRIADDIRFDERRTEAVRARPSAGRQRPGAVAAMLLALFLTALVLTMVHVSAAKPPRASSQVMSTVQPVAGVPPSVVPLTLPSASPLAAPAGSAQPLRPTFAPTPFSTPEIPASSTSPRGPADNLIVSTLAGSGTPGFADGVGASARFAYPDGVAVDAADNVYVADVQNRRIRKVTPNGTVTTLAGSGVDGFVDGPGPTAEFDSPAVVTVGPSGVLYVADYDNHAIRKVSPSGFVTTLAGSGSAGFADGVGRAAEFNLVGGLAVDGQGNVYVTDSLNNRIRRITPAGAVTTIAGTGVNGYVNGPAATAEFARLAGIALDSAGNIYVSDGGNDCIRKISPAGIVSTFAGSPTPGFLNGPGAAARFNGPSRLAFDGAGNLYVVDTNNFAVRKISPSGQVSTVAGGRSGYVDGPATSAEFTLPEAIAVDQLGNIYVADQNSHSIRKISPSSGG